VILHFFTKAVRALIQGLGLVMQPLAADLLAHKLIMRSKSLVRLRLPAQAELGYNFDRQDGRQSAERNGLMGTCTSVGCDSCVAFHSHI
jgi:hypothetical protein